MEIRTKFKKNQKVWCLWLGLFEIDYVPRRATVIDIERNETYERNIYKLHYDNSQIDFNDTEDYIFATKEEAQKECDRRNAQE